MDLAKAKSEKVTCLGHEFENDEARREHFTQRLREHLADPSFRSTPGFPQGSDEDIIKMSDPPYYTACPNPFIAEIVAEHGKPYDGSVDMVEPFAADVSEGKNHPIYNLHSYHTKVPHKAIMRYILHYTKPGELVFDGFCGTGMTGVAAQLCGDTTAVRELGYKVSTDGEVLRPDGEGGWEVFSQLGARRAILNDLSPYAAFIASQYNSFDPDDYQENEIIDRFSQFIEEMHPSYLTAGPNGMSDPTTFSYVIWSEVFSCPSCQFEDSLFGFSVSDGDMKDKFDCPNCKSTLKKGDLERVWETVLDLDGTTTLKEAKTKPVEIVASLNGKTKRYPATQYDLDASQPKRNSVEIPDAEFPHGRQTRKVRNGSGISKVHQMFTPRALTFVGDAWSACLSESGTRAGRKALFLLSSAITLLSRRERYRDGTGKGAQSGTLYVPSLQVEKFPEDVLDRKQRQFSRALFNSSEELSTVNVGSHTNLATIPDNCMDYIFTDPPFGESLQYGELNFFHEAWFRVGTSIPDDCVMNYVHEKDLDFYGETIRKSFNEAYRILKPGRWITVEFSNTQASVWNAIQVAMQQSGFIIANVAALDKKQRSFNSVTTTTSVKQDLVISAYKPNGGLEDRFLQGQSVDDTVWDFARTHLKKLPVSKIRNGVVENVPERDARRIFDRMVAWFVRHNTPVPLSSAEFQAGLAERFPERDEMFFLPSQVDEYDKKRLQAGSPPQRELFVDDERTAIDWVAEHLKSKPSTYQELHPEFTQRIGAGWRKHEEKPELSQILEENFLNYDGTGPVPAQIHRYLSSNWKELRNLEKDAPALVAKARNRWYVPDPNKQADVEKRREKALLKEFETYRAHRGRKLKEVRLEVLRAGFKAAWTERDYQTIVDVANKIPEDAWQEDERLLMYHSMAETRLEAAG
ncbi:DNA methyltransferase [Pacificimonas flava]|nr:DNA methyltransferase [Pacificimonas flava]MBB5281537.1 DNA modification methylase [Pacificimonas flava]